MVRSLESLPGFALTACRNRLYTFAHEDSPVHPGMLHSVLPFLRARAVAEGDKALYMSLLAPEDPAFLLEQSRWFDYRLSAELHEFSLEAESLSPAGPGECRVALRQKYLLGEGREVRDCRFVQFYRKTGGAWREWIRSRPK